MEKEPHLIPDEAVKGIASGLVMMAILTLVWAAIAFGGLYQTPVWMVFNLPGFIWLK
jgi:hypothetical protein